MGNSSWLNKWIFLLCPCEALCQIWCFCLSGKYNLTKESDYSHVGRSCLNVESSFTTLGCAAGRDIRPHNNLFACVPPSGLGLLLVHCLRPTLAQCLSIGCKTGPEFDGLCVGAFCLLGWSLSQKCQFTRHPRHIHSVLDRC